MNKFLVTLFSLLLLSFEAGAATYYVTPTGAGATNGTSLANAFAGWSDIPGNTFVAGDVLCVVGELNSDTTMKFTDAGSAGNPIIIAGDCSEGAGILDGNNTATPVLQLGDAGLAASYVRLRGLTIRDSEPTTGDCILDASLGAGGGFNEFIDSTITDCGATGLHGQKPSPTVTRTTFSGIAGDAIGLNTLVTGTITVQNSTFERWSMTSSGGDAIQVNDGSTATLIEIKNNTIYFDSTTTTKQGIIAGADATSGVLRITDNRLIDRIGTTNNHAISVIAGKTVYVERNWVDGWKAAVTTFNAGAATFGDVYIRSNVATGSEYLVLLTPSQGTPNLYVENNSGADLINGIRATSSVAANLYVKNNVARLRSAGVDALYVSAVYNSYTGSNNNFGPDAATFIENYECGGSTYATAAAYVAACTQEVGTTSSDPTLLGGTNPTTADGFKLKSSSSLCGAGTPTDAKYDYEGYRFGIPPNIGAFATCERNAPFTDRTIFTDRTTYVDR